MIYYDFREKEIVKGDKVAYLRTRNCGLGEGIIVGFTPKMITIQYESGSNKRLERINRFKQDIVKIEEWKI